MQYGPKGASSGKLLRANGLGGRFRMQSHTAGLPLMIERFLPTLPTAPMVHDPYDGAMSTVIETWGLDL